jgi:hypothetical protein
MFDAHLPPYARRVDVLLAAALALVLLWAALAPLGAGSRERTVAIAPGTSALLAAGGRDDLPSAITLTLGVDDVLLLKNGDSVAQQFGPVLLAPGEQFRLPFEQAGDYPIAGSAWANHRLTVKVVEWPAPGWERLSWRAAALAHTLRYLPKQPWPAAG